MIKKLGFACKLSEMHPTKGVISIPEYNTQTTTATWMAKQSRVVAEDRLWSIIIHNIEATRKLVEKVGTWHEQLRMVRLSSDLCPLFTHESWRYFYRQSDVVSYLETHFKRVGDIARKNNVRLSMHPGQFTVIASDNPGIVENSIREVEYHADMARYMGYGQEFQGMKINVHISGRRGPTGIRESYQRLSSEARNCLTLENEENAWGLDDCLSLSDLVPTVLDVHHHFIREGEYIEATDPRIQRVVDSWRGVRPTFHYSQSREDYLVGHDQLILPEMAKLLETGYRKQKLRAHSDFMWNQACNEWALTHLEWGDCMVECKSKNLGSNQLHEFWKALSPDYHSVV